jgi:Rad3-related DNA helicase
MNIRVCCLSFTESQQRGEVDFNTLLNQFYSACDVGNGAIFFAVCKGKISEGINFNDSFCRCVIQVFAILIFLIF